MKTIALFFLFTVFSLQQGQASPSFEIEFTCSAQCVYFDNRSNQVFIEGSVLGVSPYSSSEAFAHLLYQCPSPHTLVLSLGHEVHFANLMNACEETEVRPHPPQPSVNPHRLGG